MCVWEKVCRFTWTGYMNTSASAVSVKQRDPTSQGYFTASRLLSDDHTSFTASHRMHASTYRTGSDPRTSYVCKCGECVENMSFTKFAHKTYSTHAYTVRQIMGLHIHAKTQSTSPQFPKQVYTQQTLLPSALLLKMNLQGPLRKTALYQGCPGTLTVAVSLHAQTPTAVMGRRSAPTLRQGNWLEMMGHKHTSQGRRSAKQTAN